MHLLTGTLPYRKGSHRRNALTTKKAYRWTVAPPPPDGLLTRLSEELTLAPSLVSVLINRGIITTTTVVDTIHVTDPYGNLAEAVERRLADGSDRPSV